MTTPDVCQLTISGHVRREPQLHEEPEGESSCTFMLTHVTEHEQSGHWELGFYPVSIHGPLPQSFTAGFVPGQKLILCGRLDCELQRTLTGYEPHVSILADSIITLRGQTEHISTTAEQLLHPEARS